MCLSKVPSNRTTAVSTYTEIVKGKPGREVDEN